MVTPPALAAAALDHLVAPGRGRRLGARDEGLRPREAGRVRRPQWLGERPEGLRHQLRAHPGRVVRRDDAPVRQVGRGRQPPAPALGVHLRPPGRAPVRREEVEHRLAVPCHRPVQVDEVRDPPRQAVRNAGDDHRAVAVADQHDVAEVLVLEDAEHVLDVGVEVDPGVGEVDPLAKPGEGRGEDLVTSSSQQWDHPRPAPTAVHRAVDEDEGRHRDSPSTRPGTHSGPLYQF